MPVRARVRGCVHRSCMPQDQFFGNADDSYVALLTEDHGEVLREGEFGDENVALEDRLITSSLRGYKGPPPPALIDVHAGAEAFDLP